MVLVLLRTKNTPRPRITATMATMANSSKATTTPATTAEDRPLFATLVVSVVAAAVGDVVTESEAVASTPPLEESCDVAGEVLGISVAVTFRSRVLVWVGTRDEGDGKGERKGGNTAVEEEDKTPRREEEDETLRVEEEDETPRVEEEDETPRVEEEDEIPRVEEEDETRRVEEEDEILRVEEEDETPRGEEGERFDVVVDGKGRRGVVASTPEDEENGNEADEQDSQIQEAGLGRGEGTFALADKVG